MNCVTGYKLEFTKLPTQTYKPRQLDFSQSETQSITCELNRLLCMGVIDKCTPETGDFVSHIFTRTKPSGDIRLILNLKPLNEFLVYQHFKMEHIEFVCDLVRQDDWFASLDLSDAYFSVPIHSSH